MALIQPDNSAGGRLRSPLSIGGALRAELGVETLRPAPVERARFEGVGFMAFNGLRAAPLLVISARVRNALPWLSSRHAENYEAKRRGARWTSEAEAFRRFYSRVKPRTVLDCPVGTGRWLELYQDNGASVVGVDLSKDMLAQADKKVRPGAAVRLQQGDLLDPLQAASLGSGYDLLVCTRFVHWLRAEDLPLLIRNLTTTGARSLIIGARVTHDQPMRKNKAAGGGVRSRLKQVRAFFFRNVVSHVHDEAFFLGTLKDAGWELLDKRLINRTPGSRYVYYLLQRGR
jgi:SAM-dependent methyltransferase